jgi:hypothetical protein
MYTLIMLADSRAAIIDFCAMFALFKGERNDR